MDQSQPQWSPPPQQPAGWGGPGYGGPPVRPTGVTLGAIFLIVMGILTSLLGGCVGLLGGAASSVDTQIPGFGAFGGLIAVIGIIILVLGILGIVAGAGALGGSGWARWLGIIVSVLFVIFGVLSLLGSLGTLNQSGGITSLLFSLLLTVGYALTAWAFIQANAWFSWKR
jgi:hypothetical protein